MICRQSTSLIAYQPREAHKQSHKAVFSSFLSSHLQSSSALVLRTRDEKVPVPEWHAPWELSRVIAGHLGWVRCVAMDASNEWFVTGSADRTIKVALSFSFSRRSGTSPPGI